MSEGTPPEPRKEHAAWLRIGRQQALPEAPGVRIRIVKVTGRDALVAYEVDAGEAKAHTPR